MSGEFPDSRSSHEQILGITRKGRYIQRETEVEAVVPGASQSRHAQAVPTEGNESVKHQVNCCCNILYMSYLLKCSSNYPLRLQFCNFPYTVYLPGRTRYESRINQLLSLNWICLFLMVPRSSVTNVKSTVQLLSCDTGTFKIVVWSKTIPSPCPP